MSAPCVLLSRQIICLRGQCAPEDSPVSSALHICGQKDIRYYKSTHLQYKPQKSPTHLKSPLHNPVKPILFNKRLCAFTYLCVRQHMLQKIGPHLPTNRMSSPDPFQELVDSLKKVLLHPPSPTVCPAPAPPPTSTTTSTPSPIVFASPMARPAPYSGSAEECNGFLLQCTLTIDLHPQMFPTDQSKIAFVITSLTGPALQWAETILNQAGPVTQTFSNFLAHFREVFSGSPGDSSIGEQLFQL